MGATFRLFRVGGIPIAGHASWFTVYALIAWSLAAGYFPTVLPGVATAAAWTYGLIGALLLFVSVLLHELAHSLVATAYGLRVRGITLHIFGGVSQLDEEPRTPGSEMLIALAGPAVSFAIVAGLWGPRALGAMTEGPAGAIGLYLITVNLGVGFFNLVPGFPLDGGRVLRAALWRWTGSLTRATHSASRIGVAVAFALMGLGVLQLLGGGIVTGVWMILLGLFLQHAANAAAAQTAVTQALAPLRVRDVMTADVLAADVNETVADIVDRLWDRHVATVPVLDGGRPVGVLAVASLRKLDPEQWATTRVRAVMEPIRADHAVRPEDPVTVALHQAASNGLGRVAVVDRDQLVGYLSLKDIAHVLALHGLGNDLKASGAIPGADRSSRLRKAA